MPKKRYRRTTFRLPPKPKGMTDQEHFWWAERVVGRHCTRRERQAFMLAREFKHLQPIAVRMKISASRVSKLLDAVKQKLYHAYRNPLKKKVST